MASILAIDAGQTSIRTLLIVDGERGATTKLPGILTDHPLTTQLAEVIAGVAATSGTIDRVSIGSTGLVGEEADPAGIRAIVAKHGVTEVLMAHDSITSYLGAIGDTRGAVIASGTGVVTLAVGESKVARVDGWGYLLGDAGSGYWLGRAGLDAVLRAHDGRGAQTALTERFSAEFPDIEQAYVELQSDPGKVRRIAGYASHVTELAASDEVAAEICATAASELAKSITAGLERVGEATRSDPVVCGTGGVFGASAIAEPFEKRIRERWHDVDLRAPLGAGIEGVAMLTEISSTSALYTLIARG